eukprot:2164422-Rhodomonas_salina.2
MYMPSTHAAPLHAWPRSSCAACCAPTAETHAAHAATPDSADVGVAEGGSGGAIAAVGGCVGSGRCAWERTSKSATPCSNHACALSAH